MISDKFRLERFDIEGILTKIKEYLTNFKKWIFVKERRKTVLRLYIVIIILGLLLTLINAFFPTLEMCFNLFQQEFCTTWGITLILLISIPGYFIAGNILYFFPNLPWLISFIAVIITSGLFYYFIGHILDMKKNKELNIENITKMLIYISIILLLMILLSSFAK